MNESCNLEGVIQDYTPLPDKYPDLHLVLTSKVEIDVKDFSSKFDYVQSLSVDNKYGRLYKLAKVDTNGIATWGILYYHDGLWLTTSIVVLPAKYESIEIVYFKGKVFSAIVKTDGMYGIAYWNSSYKEAIMKAAHYDFMEKMENKRIKGVKDGRVTYFDEVGDVYK